MKVEPIVGEFGLRYWVESRSQPEFPHMVDLAFHNGYGRCGCIHWQTTIWPAIRDGMPMHTMETTCAHTRAALRYFLQMSLAAWIEYYGQVEGKPGGG